MIDALFLLPPSLVIPTESFLIYYSPKAFYNTQQIKCMISLVNVNKRLYSSTKYICFLIINILLYLGSFIVSFLKDELRKNLNYLPIVYCDNISEIGVVGLYLKFRNSMHNAIQKFRFYYK